MPKAEAAASADIAERLAGVRAQIAAAADRAGRPPESVTLVAVSKTVPVERIRLAIEAGQKHFGENRVQEAQAKWPALKEEFPDIILHLIGPLQTNKARDAVALFDVIETVDRERLAAKLGQEIERQDRHPRLLVEVNTGEEEQKAGLAPREVPAFVERMRSEFGLRAEGLMCIPPADEEPALHFALLEKIGRSLGLGVLSMGMSADFEAAIQFGATEVRIGTAIFGERVAHQT